MATGRPVRRSLTPATTWRPGFRADRARPTSSRATSTSTLRTSPAPVRPGRRHPTCAVAAIAAAPRGTTFPTVSSSLPALSAGKKQMGASGETSSPGRLAAAGQDAAAERSIPRDRPPPPRHRAPPGQACPVGGKANAFLRANQDRLPTADGGNGRQPHPDRRQGGRIGPRRSRYGAE